MKGDFTRDTFDQTKHFSRVLMQQGRVLLDADWNEQAAILLHHLHTLAADLIGPYGGPGILDFVVIAGYTEFKDIIEKLKLTEEEAADLHKRLSIAGVLIGKGHYYVDGILCENEGFTPCSGRLDLSKPQPPTWKPGYNLAYLDVWEGHITCLEDDSIRETALGGPNTATRAKVVWQAKAEKVEFPEGDWEEWPNAKRQQWVDEQWGNCVKNCQLHTQAKLKVRCGAGTASGSSGAGYRGSENGLYRVEIHWGGGEGDKKSGATFKWSRDNGAVAFGVDTSQSDAALPNTVFLKRLGQGFSLDLARGDIVELVSAQADLWEERKHEPLFRVASVAQDTMAVTLESTPTLGGSDLLLRRWDHGKTSSDNLADDLAVLIREGTDETNWLELEDGLQVQFQTGQQYRTGDYWLIPVRAATGTVDWPGTTDKNGVWAPNPLPPHGIKHHYAPLAIVKVGGTSANPEYTFVCDLRCVFNPWAHPVEPPGSG